MGSTASSPANGGSSNAFEPVGNGTPSSATAADDDNDDLCCLAPRPPSQKSAPPKPVRQPPPSITTSSNGTTTSPSKHLRQPKKLLWGCSNAEEHYQYIADACQRIKSLHGDAGLRELGLEYQRVHNPLTCQCDVDLDDYGSHTMDDLDPSQWEGEYGNDDGGDDHAEEEEYMVPIEMPLNDDGPRDGADHMEDEGADSANLTQDGSIPEYDADENDIDNNDDDDGKTAPLTKSLSNVSLFSLATHHTWSADDENDHPEELEEHECALRLVHVPPPALAGHRPPTLIEADNFETFIAPGVMYEEVSRLCTEHAQAIMMEEGHLSWATVCKDRGIRALVSKDRAVANRRQKKKVLLVVTGKGKVGAGIFSRRHLITTGVEASTALPMIREARKRDMDVIILDPNANGDVNGMDTVDSSLRYFFPVDGSSNDEEEVYVIAHSMAGAQIVRYLHGDKQVGKESSSSSSREDELALFRTIQAFAFTDSNHNINWTNKTNPELTDMLIGPSSLYIKSHKIHQDEPKELGTPHHDCQFWRHRFGDIRTIWAGTHEHALTNYTARHYIWDHFDSFGGNINSDGGDAGESKDEEETALTF